MKTRNGFVSNSSSSSFVVAFPKRPKTLEEVKKFLFGDKNAEGEVEYYDSKIPVDQVAEQVLRDIQDIKRSLSKKRIVKKFCSGWRYHYWVNGSDDFDIVDGVPVFTKKYFDGEGEPYFGNDKKALEELRIVEIEHNEKQKDYWEQYHYHQDRMKSKLGPQPDYSDKKAYKDYKTKLDAIEKQDKEWQEFRNNNNRFDDDYWKKNKELTQKCAEADVEEFLEDNKGCFITSFEYSDNDGDFFCLMEHGDIFKNLNHVRFNHH